MDKISKNITWDSDLESVGDTPVSVIESVSDPTENLNSSINDLDLDKELENIITIPKTMPVPVVTKAKA